MLCPRSQAHSKGRLGEDPASNRFSKRVAYYRVLATLPRIQAGYLLCRTY